MGGALIEQAAQFVYEFSPRSEITLQLADLIFRSGNLFCRSLVEHCRNDIELGLDGFVRRLGAGSECRAAAARLFCNSSVNHVSESFRRPDDAHNCDPFI